MSHSPIHYWIYDSPVGPLLIGGQDGNLDFLSFAQSSDRPVQIGNDWVKSIEPFKRICGELDQYFNKDLVNFSIPYRLQGSQFQKAVWKELARIPFGKLRSYGDIAKILGQPGASRAVGLANNANPLPIIIPCHRVIGANGKLVGFGGGMNIKIQLLEHEGIDPRAVHSPDQMGFDF